MHYHCIIPLCITYLRRETIKQSCICIKHPCALCLKINISLAVINIWNIAKPSSARCRLRYFVSSVIPHVFDVNQVNMMDTQS